MGCLIGLCYRFNKRCSDSLIVPGTQIDLSDVKHKKSWQDNDKYFGVPYPKE